ncbi:DNA-binding storekeeper protein-related transcriptional regulator [Forsythia ovata]|uniref:DNA-binding storekeeper protein-related transcriptional regulator n=1 Tax=Forsythia ovata TaxID=205694 RepID=A0ABD1RKU4_9LAMI
MISSFKGNDSVIAAMKLGVDATTADDLDIAFSDESHKLFQRLWTNDDEIELLQGFLDIPLNNPVVEQLKRLKKKYRNVISKSGSGKDHAFKSLHDQATFEISCKIWDDTAGVNGTTVRVVPTDEVGFDDNDHNNPNFVGN